MVIEFDICVSNANIDNYICAFVPEAVFKQVSPFGIKGVVARGFCSGGSIGGHSSHVRKAIRCDKGSVMDSRRCECLRVEAPQFIIILLWHRWMRPFF